MFGQGKPQPQPPSPQAASAPLFFLPPVATLFFGVVVVVAAAAVVLAGAVAVVLAGAAAVVLAGASAAVVVAGAAAAAVVAGAVLAADAASPEVVDSVAGLASALASAGFSALFPPQAPLAAQLDFASFPAPLGTSVAGELAWLPAHALSTAPEPITAKAAANLLNFMLIVSIWFSSCADLCHSDEKTRAHYV